MENNVIEVGSKVFLKDGAGAREHEIVAFRLMPTSNTFTGTLTTEFECYVETVYGPQRSPAKCKLETFIKNYKAAQDMKISEIQR